MKTQQQHLGQTRTQSGIETLITNVVGFSSVVILQIFLLPLYGIHVRLSLILSLTLIPYVLALPRTYLLRRLFNRWHRDGQQPRWQSMTETGIDLAMGYALNVLTLSIVFPLLGYQVSLGSNAQISAIFYVFAYVRKFVLRRIFNRVWPRAESAALGSGGKGRGWRQAECQGGGAKRARQQGAS